nr:unnamed protein product [Callosobruchus chinensis]
MAHVSNDELLIILVEQCAHLYDKASKSYKDERLKENTWKPIAEKLETEQVPIGVPEVQPEEAGPGPQRGTTTPKRKKTIHESMNDAISTFTDICKQKLNTAGAENSDLKFMKSVSIEVPIGAPEVAGPGPQRGTTTPKRKKTIHESMNDAISTFTDICKQKLNTAGAENSDLNFMKSVVQDMQALMPKKKF